MDLGYLPSDVRAGALWGEIVHFFFPILGLDQEPEIAEGRFPDPLKCSQLDVRLHVCFAYYLTFITSQLLVARSVLARCFFRKHWWEESGHNYFDQRLIDGTPVNPSCKFVGEKGEIQVKH